MGGKSSSTTIGYWYGGTFHMGLSHGPLDEILEIRGDDKIMFPLIGQKSVVVSGTVAINARNLYGGEKQEGGVQGTLTVLMGEATQMPSAALAKIEPTVRPAYRNICTVAFTGLVGAMSPYVKAWRFRVRRHVQGWNTPVWHPELCKVGRGMNPAHIIYQVLTDPVWSASEDAGQGLDDASFLTAAQTLSNEGMGLCLKWSSADAVGDFINVVLNHIGALRYIDPTTNRAGIRLLRADYNVATLAANPDTVLDENDIIEMTSFQVPVLDQSVNQVTVTYRDVDTNEDAAVVYQNLANIQAQGKVVDQSTAYPGAWSATLASRMAARDCHTLSSLLAKGECKVKSTRWKIKVGDVLLLSWAREKVVQMPIRVLKVNYGDSTARSITLSWAQDEFALPSTSYLAPGGTLWQEPDRTPQAITTAQVLEMPYRDLVRALDPANLQLLTPDIGYLSALAVRPSGVNYNYHLFTRLGAAAFADRGGGDFISTGTLAAAIGPTETAIALAAFDDLSVVQVGSAALLDAEVVRIDGINTVTGSVTLGRGCVDTVPAAHALGARLWFYQGHIGTDSTQYVVGESINAKLLTVSGAGMLDQSVAATLTLQMKQRPARPYPPGNLRVAGNRYPASVVGSLVLAWSHRSRVLQADQMVDTLQVDVGPESGTTYTVRVYLNGMLDSTTTGITAAALTPDVSGAGTVRVEIDAVRGGLASWQPLTATFVYVAAPLALSGTYAAARIGAAYSSDLSITGGSGTYGNPRAAAGSVPAGLSLSVVSGKCRLSGTPTGAAGTFDVTVAVDSSDGGTATSAQSIVVNAAFVGFSTWNPTDMGAGVVLSNGNLDATWGTGGGSWEGVRVTTSLNSGQAYFEVQDLNANDNCLVSGVAAASATLASYPGADANGWGLNYNWSGGLRPVHSGAFGTLTAGGYCRAGDRMMCAVDFVAGKIWFGTKGTWAMGADPATGEAPTYTFTPGTALYIMSGTASGGSNRIVSNPSLFAYAPPAGFTGAWGT